MALGRLAMLKSAAFTNIGAGTAYDAELMALLEAATAVLNGKTGRELVRATYTGEYFTGTGGKMYYPREYPVWEIDELRYGTGGGVIDPSRYELRERRYIWLAGGGAFGFQLNLPSSGGGFADGAEYAVDYQAGYSDAGWDTLAVSDSGWNVPVDLEYACCALAEAMWKQGKVGGAQRLISSATSGPEGAQFTKYEKGIPDEVEQIINHYRRVSI